MSNYTLIEGEALCEMAKLPANSINLISVDVPYGTTQNKWDIIIPPKEMFSECDRLLTKDGIMVMTATEPFTSMLIVNNIEMKLSLKFKYDLIWEKTISSGQLNVNRMPLRSHESILVFNKGKGTYNEQKLKGDPYSIKRKAPNKSNYGEQKDSELINDGTRRARSVIKISNPRIKGGHPTQKPIQLMDYIINTYSNENDTVLDFCMGSGSCGVSAIKNNRHFIGIELDNFYYTMAHNNIEKEYGNVE